MKNIAVVFGGRSVEHDISILTGLHAAMHIQSADVYYVYLDRENRMYVGDRLASIDYYIEKTRPVKRCWFTDGCLCWGRKRKIKIDAVLNCCHGGIGENGELAAYFKVAGVPVTSCDYISAAKMQSKIRTREILTVAGFEQPKYSVANKGCGLPVNLPDFPLIVKPDTLGSSIGITVVRNEAQLAKALELVFVMDERAIIEEFFEGITEVNCAAMRAIGEIKVSECEEINSKREYLDYESKYLDSSSGFIKKGETTGEKKDFSKIQELTRRAYELFGARGVVRADFIIHGEKIYLNEINTVPGFLAYHLWARAKIPFALVIDLAVKQAIIDEKITKSFQTVFKSDILIRNRELVR